MDQFENLFHSIISNYNIIYDDKLVDDINDAIQNSGLENAFFNQFFVRLQQLSQYGYQAHQMFDNFERLVDQDLYSMKLTPKDLNFRILYTIENDIILLHGFVEKTKGKDYRRAIKKANNRLNLLKGELK